MDAKKAGTAYCLGDWAKFDQLNIKEINGIFDVFGDKSVAAFPAPGHTPGQQALYVKISNNKSLILTSDALYWRENMEKMIPPTVVVDTDTLLQTFRWIKMLDIAGVEIVTSHDPVYWKNKQWAPNVMLP